MTKILKGHERINELIEKYHEVATPINEAIQEVDTRKENLLKEIEDLKGVQNGTVDEKIEQTKEIVKKEKEFKTLLDVENQLERELEEKTRGIKNELASAIVGNWDTPIHNNFTEVITDYKNLSKEIKEKVKVLEEKHNKEAKEKTEIMLKMYKKVDQVLNDDDLIIYEKAAKALDKIDIYPISHFNRELDEFVDLLKEGY